MVSIIAIFNNAWCLIKQRSNFYFRKFLPSNISYRMDPTTTTENHVKRKLEDGEQQSSSSSPEESIVPLSTSSKKEQNFEFFKKIKLLKKEVIETSLDISDYYIANGNRKVYPYPYHYYAHCKSRWIGKTLKELFAQEFKALSSESINSRASKGYLKVNGETVNADYILKDNDFITNRVHRHEFPVLAAPIPIIHSDEECLVIDKPPSIPVHPCGKYRLNSILSLLAKENHLKNLHVVHRLDRLTSGIMIFGKTKARAQKLHEEMRNRAMHKEYVCRVEGRFPDGAIECDQPIETVAHRIGICMVSPKGKPSKTIFERLNFNGKSSTVLCKPLTGRMHQIRVHLQYLGYPIVNDNFYNSPAWGDKKGHLGDYGKTLDQLIEDIEKEHDRKYYMIGDDEDANVRNDIRAQDDRNIVALKALEHYQSQPNWKELEASYQFQPSKYQSEDDCDECRIQTVEPTASEQLIYLHALRYEGKDWSYQTAMPVWAQDSWTYD